MTGTDKLKRRFDDWTGGGQKKKKKSRALAPTPSLEVGGGYEWNFVTIIILYYNLGGLAVACLLA